MINQNDQTLVQLQKYAKSILSTNYQQKMAAEQLIKSYFTTTMNTDHLAQIMHKGSDELLFVTSQILHRLLFKFNLNALINIYQQITQSISLFFNHQSSLFVRTNPVSHNPQPLPKYIINSLSMLYGQTMKYIHVKIIEINSGEKYAIKLSEFTKSIDAIKQKSSPVLKLYAWKCYTSSVSSIDHNLSFSGYRDLSMTFQKYIIPQVIDMLCGDEDKYFEEIQSQIDLKQVETLQEELDIDDGQQFEKGINKTKNMREKAQRIELYSKIIRQNSKVDFILTLLHKISCFPYNIVYTQYQAAQNLFQHCSISFPDEVSHKIVTNNFITTLVQIIKKFLLIIQKFLQSGRNIDITNTKQINTVWQSFNKFIMMRSYDFSKSVIDNFYIQILKGAMIVSQPVLTIIDTILKNVQQMSPSKIRMSYNLLKLMIQTYKNIHMSIEAEKIIELSQKQLLQIYQIFINNMCNLHCKCLQLFPIFGEYSNIQSLCISFWNQFQKQQTFVANRYHSNFSLSIYYQESSGCDAINGILSQNLSLDHSKKQTYAVINQCLISYLRALFDDRSCILGKRVQQQDLSLQHLQELSQQTFDGLQNMFLFSGSNNYKLMTQTWIFSDRKYFISQNRKTKQSNFILLCAFLLNSYPQIERYTNKYIYEPDTPHISDTILQAKLTNKLIFGYILTGIAGRQNCQNIDNHQDEVFQYSCIIFVYKFLFEILSHLSFQFTEANNDLQSWQTQRKNAKSKYNENLYYQYNSVRQNSNRNIKIVSKSDLWKDLTVVVDQKSPFFNFSWNIDNSINISLGILTNTFGLLQSTYQFCQIIKPNFQKGLQILLIWCYSYLANKIKKYTNLAFYHHKNLYLIDLLGNIYHKLSTVILKYKWTLHRQKLNKTLTGVYLLQLSKNLLTDTISHINNSVVMLENDYKKVIDVVENRQKLMKIITALMFDDTHDEYQTNIDNITQFISGIFALAKTSNNNINYLCVIHDLIGIFDTIDTSKIWKYFINSFNKKCNMLQMMQHMFQWAINLPIINKYSLKVKQKIIGNIVKLERLTISNKFHRLSGNFNIVKSYQFLKLYLIQWKPILSQFCKNGNSQIKYDEPVLQILYCMDSIIKSGMINFSLLLRYQPQFGRYWQLFFETMAMIYSQKQDQPLLIKVCKNISNQLWKFNVIEYILTSSTSDTIKNFSRIICFNIGNSIELISQKIKQMNVHDTPTEIEYPLQSTYRTIKIALRSLQYKHKPTLIQIIKYFLSFFQSAKCLQFMKVEPHIHYQALINQFFWKLCEYLLIFLNSERKQIYVVKLISNLIFIFGYHFMTRQTVDAIQRDKISNGKQRFLSQVIFSVETPENDQENTKNYLLIKEYFQNTYCQKQVDTNQMMK